MSAESLVAPYTFEQSSVLPGTTVAEVWDRVSQWDGVNHELGPLFRMTYPPRFTSLVDIPADGECHFTSTILFLGLIPFDRHQFRLMDLQAPVFFDECSSNMTMAVWTHRRTLEVVGAGVKVTDQCTFEPRFSFMGPMLHRVYSGVFARRHRRLRAHFAC